MDAREGGQSPVPNGPESVPGAPASAVPGALEPAAPDALDAATPGATEPAEAISAEPAVASPSPPAVTSPAEPAAPSPGDPEAQSPAELAPENPGALIFDLDGTLVDTVELRIEAWLRTFAEIGFPAERSHVAGLIGADGKRLALEVAAVADRRLSDERAEAVDRRAGEIFSELNTAPRPLPGVVALLRALEGAGLPWSIATSSRPDQVRASVAALNLATSPHVTDGSHVPQAKPAPDLLLAAAEQLGVKTYRCWYVGDATWDMRAARSAAMVGVGIGSGAASLRALEEAGARLSFQEATALHAELVDRGVLPATGEPVAA